MIIVNLYDLGYKNFTRSKSTRTTDCRMPLPANEANGLAHAYTRAMLCIREASSCHV